MKKIFKYFFLFLIFLFGLILIAPEDREWVKCSDEKDLYRYVYNGWKVDKVIKDYKGEYPQIFLSKIYKLIMIRSPQISHCKD